MTGTKSISTGSRVSQALPARPSGKDKLQAKQLSLHKFQFSAQK